MKNELVSLQLDQERTLNAGLLFTRGKIYWSEWAVTVISNPLWTGKRGISKPNVTLICVQVCDTNRSVCVEMRLPFVSSISWFLFWHRFENKLPISILLLRNGRVDQWRQVRLIPPIHACIHAWFIRWVFFLNFIWRRTKDEANPAG